MDKTPRNEKVPRVCETCRHWWIEAARRAAPHGGNWAWDLGECRRYPPRREPPAEAAFPVTASYIGCGEWTRKERD